MQAPKDKDSAQQLLSSFRARPKLFLTEVLGIKSWWAGMDAMCEAAGYCLGEGKPLVVTSGHALSKDYTFSALALWFLYSFGPRCRCIMTAPTDRQVKQVMWAELGNHWRRAKIPLGGELQAQVLRPDPALHPSWDLIGFTTKDTTEQKGKFHGYHAESMMVIVSEAEGVEDEIFDEIDGILTSDKSLLVMLGNPLRTTGRFARAIKDTEANVVLRFDCRKSPNVLAGKEIIPGMVSKRWVDDKERRWNSDGNGDHPLYMAKVCGLVPHTSIDTVFSETAVRNSLDKVPLVSRRRCVIACDPAAFGDDETVIYALDSGRVVGEVVMAKQRGAEVAAQCAIMRRKHNASAIALDPIGIGRSVLEPLQDMGENVIECNAAAAPTDTERKKIYDFQNLRAEMWFYAAEELAKGRVVVPNDEHLIEELCEVHYLRNKKSNKLQLEDKDEVKDRIGRSPDRADAWIMAVWALKDVEDTTGTDDYGKHQRRVRLTPAYTGGMAA